MTTFILKRKGYSTQNDLQDTGSQVGSQAGSAVGGVTGAALGGVAAGTLGAGIGSVKGANQVLSARKDYNKATQAVANAKNATKVAQASGTTEALKSAANAREAAGKAVANSRKTVVMANKSVAGNALKKAGKIGAIAAGVGAVAGGLLGSSTGSKAGEAIGSGAGSVTGNTLDSVNTRISGVNQTRGYSVSSVTKGIYKVAKPLTPKSHRMKIARKAVGIDQAAKKTAFEMGSNPGKVASKVIQKASENPVTMMPGGLSVGGSIATAINKGKPSTIDSLLKKTKIGKPLYAATEYTGRTIGKVAEPVVNSAYNIVKVL